MILAASQSYITQYDEASNKWPLLIAITKKQAVDHEHIAKRIFDTCQQKRMTKDSIMKMRNEMLTHTHGCDAEMLKNDNTKKRPAANDIDAVDAADDADDITIMKKPSAKDIATADVDADDITIMKKPAAKDIDTADGDTTDDADDTTIMKKPVAKDIDRADGDDADDNPIMNKPASNDIGTVTADSTSRNASSSSSASASKRKQLTMSAKEFFNIERLPSSELATGSMFSDADRSWWSP